MSRETLEQKTATSAQPPSASPFSWSRISRLLRTTDFGQFPVVVALIFIALFFEIRSNGLFLNSENLTNLVLQIGYIGTVGLGAVLVLLIGEIDLEKMEDTRRNWPFLRDRRIDAYAPIVSRFLDSEKK